jgi:hypothetical protein
MIFKEANDAGELGRRIYIPRRVISAGQAINEAVAEGKTEVEWSTVGVDDPRILSNIWYTEGRLTPPAGT